MREAGAPAAQWQARLRAARAADRGASAPSTKRELQSAVATVGRAGRSPARRPSAREPCSTALRERVLERNYINNLLATDRARARLA